jgi:hypothetical protein
VNSEKDSRRSSFNITNMGAGTIGEQIEMIINANPVFDTEWRLNCRSVLAPDARRKNHPSAATAGEQTETTINGGAVFEA